MFGCFCFCFCIPSIDSIGDLIGKRGSVRVYIAVKGEKKFVIKRLPYETKDEIELADNEERMLESLSGLCPYLMNTEDSFEDVFVIFILFIYFYLLICLFSQKSGFKYFVMKFCKTSLKDLRDELLKSNVTISEDRVWKIISQFYIALAALDDKNMVHGNVRERNIFIDEDDNIVLGLVTSIIGNRKNSFGGDYLC
jgi:serine/threonine protein kinase